MRAMVMNGSNHPLELREMGVPEIACQELLVRVRACGVCRTDLHVVDGELSNPKQNVIPGHEVVGEVQAIGEAVTRFQVGQRVGIPWLGQTCGHCKYCLTKRENLCDEPLFTGYTRDGGYAEFTVVHENFALAIPNSYTDAEAAPLHVRG